MKTFKKVFFLIVSILLIPYTLLPMNKENSTNKKKYFFKETLLKKSVRRDIILHIISAISSYYIIKNIDKTDINNRPLLAPSKALALMSLVKKITYGNSNKDLICECMISLSAYAINLILKSDNKNIIIKDVLNILCLTLLLPKVIKIFSWILLTKNQVSPLKKIHNKRKKKRKKEKKTIEEIKEIQENYNQIIHPAVMKIQKELIKELFNQVYIKKLGEIDFFTMKYNNIIFSRKYKKIRYLLEVQRRHLGREIKELEFIETGLIHSLILHPSNHTHDEVKSITQEKAIEEIEKIIEHHKIATTLFSNTLKNYDSNGILEDFFTRTCLDENYDQSNQISIKEDLKRKNEELLKELLQNNNNDDIEAVTNNLYSPNSNEIEDKNLKENILKAQNYLISIYNNKEYTSIEDKLNI
jgi:hypothetical protein